MTLDLAAASKQIKAMAENLVSLEDHNQEMLDLALQQLASCSDDFHALRERAEASKTHWPVARPLQKPNGRWPLPRLPKDYTILATDGSQIEPDRHGLVLCFLINTGSVLISYGSRSRAVLQSTPYLGYSEEDIYIKQEAKRGGRKLLVDGHILDLRRSVMESQKLAELGHCCDREEAVIAVQDGNLDMRTAEGWGQEKNILQDFLKDFLSTLDDLRGQGIPAASYVSRPRSTEVGNLLRVLACPHQVADCDRQCPSLSERENHPCARLVGMLDGMLYERFLSPGERSALFRSASPMSLEHYGENRICFFYLHVGPEVARVEIPEWVTLNEEYVDRVHAVLYDQCQRGDGYPRALMEAHEKAVLTTGDRQQFQALLDSCLMGRGMVRSFSQKQRSKRLRGL